MVERVIRFRWKNCMGCGEEMRGIVCNNVRTHCDDCGGESLSESSVEALRRRRVDRGEISNVVGML